MRERDAEDGRLDSWKAIARYLKRDIATVARWEKTLGLPVRRVGGSGRSVFAYQSEIDAWLQTARPALAGNDTGADSVGSLPSGHRPRLAWALAVLGTLALAASWAWYSEAGPPPGELRVDMDPIGLVARNSAGAELWRYDFPADSTTVLPGPAPSPPVVSGAVPVIYAATSHSIHRVTKDMSSGVFRAFDARGRLTRSFEFDDRVRFAATSYAAPWGITAFSVDDRAGDLRIAVAAHHHTWDPSLVTILDADWKRQGTFVHAGWIEFVRWLTPDRLLIGGFSQSRDGGMVAILAAEALDGQGPEAPGTRYHCESCAEGGALRMIVMPRSEVNLVSGSRFNRAILQVAGGQIVARTIEVPQLNTVGDADALYEFTPDLDLVRATFSERYWDVHRSLEAGGKLDHSREQCPDRDGPPQVWVWEASGGWRTVSLR